MPTIFFAMRFAVQRSLWLRPWRVLGFTLVLFAVYSPSALGQSGKKPGNQILKQVVDFTARPNPREGNNIRYSPGETVRFIYKIYPDTEAPVRYDSAEVRLFVTKFSDLLLPIPSLIDTSFRHIASYILPWDRTRGDTIATRLPVIEGPDFFAYKLGTLKMDTLHVQPRDSLVFRADTLALEFSYAAAPLPDTLSCGRLGANLASGFFAYDTLRQRLASKGQNAANFEIDTESQIDWRFWLAHADDGAPFLPTDTLNVQDSLRIIIEYANIGNVSDLARFNITSPGRGDPREYRDWSCRAIQLPDSSGSNEPVKSTTRRSIRVTDLFVPPDTTKRFIEFVIKFDICALLDSLPRFTVSLFAPCDSSAQGTERKSKRVNIRLRNLLAVQMQVSPQSVSPTQTLNYTINVHSVHNETLDSVYVAAILDSGIQEILQPNPTWQTKTADNTRIIWLLPNLAAGATLPITFQAVIQEDYYPVVRSRIGEICTSGYLRTDSATVEVRIACAEGNFEDNIDIVFPRINPLGDQLQLSTSIANLRPQRTALPGDELRFIVVLENRNSFVSTALFTLKDSLSSKRPDYFSRPRVIYSPKPASRITRNTITVDSLRLTRGQSDSLVFAVQVLDTVQICSNDTLWNFAWLNILGGLDCDLRNNAEQDTITVVNPQTALQLELNITPSEVSPPGTATLTNVYSAGASRIPIRNIVISDTLAPGMRYASMVSGPEPQSRTIINGREVLVWDNMQLPAGGRETLAVRVQLQATLPCADESLLTRAVITASPLPCLPAQSAVVALALKGNDDLVTTSNVTITPQPGAALNAGLQESVTYSFTITNTSRTPAAGLVITNTLPAKEKFILDPTSISPAGSLSNYVIRWSIAPLDSGQNATFSFRGSLRDSVYCQADSIVNLFSVRSDTLSYPNCPAEITRTVHRIAAATSQAEFTLAEINFTDAPNGNVAGHVEPNEPVTVRVRFRNDTAQPFTNVVAQQLRVFAGDDLARILSATIPTTILPGESVALVITLIAPATIGTDSLTITGMLFSNRNCGQTFTRNIPARGAPQLEHGIVLEDGSGDGFAEEGELVTARVTLQHRTDSRFDAANVELRIAIAVAPGSSTIQLEPPDDTLIIPVGTLTLTQNNVQAIVRFRYPDLLPNQTIIVATATYTTRGFDGNGNLIDTTSPQARDDIPIRHDCFAKPRTFIPARHTGLKFKPNDGQSVYILDLDGNKVWEGTTRDTWNGQTNDGRDLPPGTYVWSIKKLKVNDEPCQGTIVLLR